LIKILLKNILSYIVLLISLLIHKLLYTSNDVKAISSVISIWVFISKDNSLVAEVDDLMKNTIKARKISIDKIMHSLYFTSFHT